MPANPSRIKNTTITLVTLGVLALATFGYFYFYIQQREDALQARHYRVLNQIKQNILSLNDTYIKNAGNNAAKDLQQLHNQAAVMYNDRIQLNNEKVNREIEILANRYRTIPHDIKDSLKTYLQDKFTFPFIKSGQVEIKNEAFEINTLKLTKRKCDTPPPNQSFQVNDSISVFVRDCQTIIVEQNGSESAISFPDIKLDITFDEFDAYHKQKINLNYKLREFKKKGADFPQSTLRKPPPVWELVYTDTISTENDKDPKPYEFELTRPFADLISKVLREDVFDEFVVYRVSKDSTDNSAGNSKYQSIFQTFEENFFSRQLAGEMDSLLLRQLDSKNRQTISGVPFRIYLQPLHLLADEELFVCGLVDQKRFESEKTRIPPLIILFFVLAALLVLLAFPSLKLFLMSKKESLNVSDLFLSLISLVMGTSLAVLLLFNGYRVFLEDEKQRKTELENLHEEIADSLFTELRSIYAQLNYYDELRGASESPFKDPILRVLSNPEDTLYYPQDYPYFNALLWATPDSRIGDEITPLDNPTPKVDITGRQYLERFREERAWELPGGDVGQQFMLESVLTRTTGDQLAVVSTSSRTEAPIVFLSTYLHSVIHPVLPLGYGFCILDQEGEVLFHSDPSRNLQENFLEECSIKDLRSTMYSRAALHTEGSYLGLDHNFYLKPLDQLPLFLVTFENKRFYRMTHAQAVSLNILFAVGFLAFVLLFLGLLHIFRPTGDSLKRTAYVLDWLRPTQINTGNYRRLLFINLLMVLLLILAAQSADDLTAIMLILGSNFYAFVLAFFHLNRDTFKEFNWSKYWHIVVALGLIFLLYNGISLLVKGIDFQKVLAFELIPMLIVIVILEAIISKPMGNASVFNAIGDRLNGFLFGGESKPNQMQEQLAAIQKRWHKFLNNRRSYRFFLLSWLAISSIFPAVKFYQISYNHERKLLTQLTHIQLDKDIQDRNLWIDQLYRTVNPPEQFLTELKHKGIYTQPFFDTRFNAPADRDVHLEITLLNPDSTFNKEGFHGEVALVKDSVVLFRLPDTIRTGQLVHPDSLAGLSLLALQTSRGDTIGFRYTGLKAGNPYVIRGMVNQRQLKDWLRGDRLWSLWDVQSAFYHKNDSLSYQLIREGVDSAYFSGKAEIDVTFQLLRPDLEGGDEASRSLASTLALFRPRFSETVRQTNQVNYDRSANELWYWINNEKENRLLYFNNQQQSSISSILPKYAFPSLTKNGGQGLLFWVFFIGGLLVLYKVLDFQITRLFAQDVINMGVAPAHSRKSQLLDTKEHVFLVVPPPPITTDFLEIIKLKTSEASSETLRPHLIDMRQVPLEEVLQIDTQSPLLVLNNFDHQIENLETYQARMRTLAHLRQQYPNKQIIIVSTKSQITQPEVNKAADTKAASLPEKQSEQFWEEIMSSFGKIVYSVEQWTRINQLEKLLTFTLAKSAFMQIVPALVKDGMLIDKHNLGALDKQHATSDAFPYYTRDIVTEGKVTSTQFYVLINGDDDATILLEKANFLKDKQAANQVIHLLSTISPVELIKRCSDASKTAVNCNEKWTRLLAGMNKGLLQISDGQPGPAEKAQSRILKETIGSNYLQNIQWELMRQFGDGKTSEVQIVREIESRAQLYYQALWNSCSEQEQYIIYDVAKDGIVNSKNREVFKRLTEKGLILIRGDNPRIMNKSFRDFVLIRVKPEDIVNMNKKVNKESSWNQAKVLITVVILALFAFFFYTQGEMIDKTLALFTGMAAFVPLLRELVSNISMPETKNVTNFFPKGWRRNK